MSAKQGSTDSKKTTEAKRNKAVSHVRHTPGHTKLFLKTMMGDKHRFRSGSLYALHAISEAVIRRVFTNGAKLADLNRMDANVHTTIGIPFVHAGLETMCGAEVAASVAKNVGYKVETKEKPKKVKTVVVAAAAEGIVA